jgi:hypothetical protein
LAGVVRRLRAHNESLKDLLTEEGKRELDKLVLLEAAVLAHLRNATDMLSSDEQLEQLLSRSRMSGFYTQQTRDEVRTAANKPGFLAEAWGKCKSVANGKVKKWASGLIGSSKDDDDAND